MGTDRKASCSEQFSLAHSTQTKLLPAIMMISSHSTSVALLSFTSGPHTVLGTLCTPSHLPSRQSTSWRWRAHGCGSPSVQWSDWGRWYCWRRGPQSQQRGRSHWNGTRPDTAHSASSDLPQEHVRMLVNSREERVSTSSQSFLYWYLSWKQLAIGDPWKWKLTFNFYGPSTA